MSFKDYLEIARFKDLLKEDEYGKKLYKFVSVNAEYGDNYKYVGNLKSVIFKTASRNTSNFHIMKAAKKQGNDVIFRDFIIQPNGDMKEQKGFKTISLDDLKKIKVIMFKE
jgi:hypothetical protein